MRKDCKEKHSSLIILLEISIIVVILEYVVHPKAYSCVQFDPLSWHNNYPVDENFCILIDQVH